MNCPNCDKQPSGFTHFLIRHGNVSFSKNTLGYFRCQHCDLLLKQQRYANMFTKYDLKFWIISPLLLSMVIFLPDLLTDLIAFLFPSLAPETPLLSGDQIPPIIIIYGIIFSITLLTAFVIIIRSMFLYLKFTVAEEEDLLRNDLYNISLKGWLIFLVFIVIYLFAGYKFLISSEMFIGNEWMYPITVGFYLLILIGGSVLISNRFSSSETTAISDKTI